MSFLDEAGHYGRDFLKRVVSQDPSQLEPIFLLIQEKGVLRKMGVAPVLDVEQHIRELRTFVQKHEATGIVAVFNGQYTEPERGPTRAILTVTLGRDGAGWASALTYRVLDGGEVEWGVEVPRPDAVDAYREVFA